jgi:hypothetical protein
MDQSSETAWVPALFLPVYDTPMLALAVTVAALFVMCLAGLIGGASAALAGPPLLTATLIVATLLVSGRCARRPAPAAELGVARQIRLWLGEIAAAWSVFLFWMPLERWLMPRDRPGRHAGQTPVLLIHGYINNAGSMWRLWRALCSLGVGVHTLNLEPVYADIDRYAALIEARVGAIRAITGVPQVMLVCHSMGGLAARAYLRLCAGQHRDPGIAKVVTLGTPHQGTALAHLEWSPNGRQMVPGNAWLAGLSADEHGTWPCPFVSLYSLDDNIVVPQRNAHLEGARNLEIEGVGHISLPLSRHVIELVQAEI